MTLHCLFLTLLAARNSGSPKGTQASLAQVSWLEIVVRNLISVVFTY